MTDTSIAALARADVDAALAYARCQSKQAGLVAAYDAVRTVMMGGGK